LNTRESLKSTAVGKATTVAIVFSIFYIVWIFTQSSDSQVSRWVSAFGQNLSLILFVYFGIAMIREYKINPVLRRSWMLLIIATGALVIAEFIHILQGRPEHSIAELFWFAYYSLYILGILLFPFIPVARNEKSLLLLDLSIVMCASLLLLWYFLADSVLTESYGALAKTIYPVLDVFILACAVTMIQRDVDGLHPAALVLIAVANGYIAIADAL
jgi:hypothetical protein